MIIIACILLIVIFTFLLVLKVQKLLSKVFANKQTKQLSTVRFSCGNKNAFSRLARDRLIWL